MIYGTVSRYNADTGEGEVLSLHMSGLSYKFKAETIEVYNETCETIRAIETAAYSSAVGDFLNHVSNFENNG